MANDRDIELRITATDDASKVIDKVADKVDDIDETVDIEVDADTGDALSDIQKFEKKLDALTSDKGREVLVEFRGQKLEAEIKRTVRQLEALEDPVEIEAKTADLERAQQDLEDLKKLANDKYEIDVQIKGDSTKKLDEFKHKADEVADTSRTTSTAIGGIGGSVSELPGVGSLGPIAESLGQLSENALEGEASLKGIATAGAALGVTALAMYGISRGAKQAADRTEDLTETIEDLTTASDELFAITAAEAWVRMFERAALDGEGLQEQVDALAESNLVGAKRMLDNADAIGLNAEARRMLAAAIAEVERSEAQGAITEEKYGKTVEDTGAKAEAAARRAEILANSQARVAEESEAANQALRDEAALLEAQANAMRAAADSGFAVVLAQNNLDDALANSVEVLKDSKSTYNDHEEALIGVATAAGGAADAAVQLATDQAAANGTTLSQSKATELWNKSMLASASTMSGPQRRAILDYVANVNGIPPEKVTEIEALLDQGKIAEAEAALNTTSRKRDAEIEAEAKTDKAEADLTRLERQREMRITATIDPRLPPGWRYNGNGDLVTPGGGVIRSAPVAPPVINPLPAAATNITVNLPRAAEARDVTRALSRWARVNGG